MNDDRWKHDKGRNDELPKVPGAPYVVPDGFFENETYRAFIDHLPEYALFDRAPKILAAAARAKGGKDLGPRDFECACPIDADDSLPRCLGLRVDCRFSTRLADKNAPVSGDDDNIRQRAALEAIVEEMAAFFQANDAGRRRINQRFAQAAARRRRRMGNTGSFPARPAIEGPPKTTGDET